MNVRYLITVIVCSALLAASWPAGAARADEFGYDHPLIWVVFGTLLVDTGVTIANSITLSSGTANPRNGWVGVGAGIVSYGLIGVAYAVGDDVGSEFPIVMGTAGTAALVTGFLVLRSAGGEGGHAPSTGSRVTIHPCLVRGDEGRLGPGIAMNLRF